MDPLCHTFVGACLAGSRLGERSWGAAATLVVAANLPDVDVLSYAWGADTALGFRRGWTHGVLAIVVLPALLAGVVVALGRRRGAAGVRPGQLLLLAYLALLTHPSLDWLNTYGMRWLMPFDGRWSYGDTLFIVDPWLWLVLGGGAFLRYSGSPRAVAAWGALAVGASIPILASGMAPPWAGLGWAAGLLGLVTLRWRGGPLSPSAGARVAAFALAGAVLYVGAVGLLGRLAAARVGAAAGVEAMAPVDVFVGPLPADPTRWDVLVVTADGYRPGVYRFGRDLTLEPDTVPLGTPDRRVATALDAPCVRGMRRWMRYPFFVVTELDDGARVHLLDARYVRRVSRGFGSATVRLDESGRVVGCR